MEVLFLNATLGRYIGECTRLIVDLIERAEEDTIPGIMLPLDFEKAFDTMNGLFS